EFPQIENSYDGVRLWSAARYGHQLFWGDRSERLSGSDTEFDAQIRIRFAAWTHAEGAEIHLQRRRSRELRLRGQQEAFALNAKWIRGSRIASGILRLIHEHQACHTEARCSLHRNQTSPRAAADGAIGDSDDSLDAHRLKFGEGDMALPVKKLGGKIIVFLRV